MTGQPNGDSFGCLSYVIALVLVEIRIGCLLRIAWYGVGRREGPFGGIILNVQQRLDEILLQVQKPGRYVGGEPGSIVKEREKTEVRFAFCFPDTYEVGMSHLGMKILYGLLNQEDYCWCERVFAPWMDMEEKMREAGIPLYGLESFDALSDFDIIGFTLQYELSFTNILNMLDLGGVPVLAKDRQELRHLVVAGGPCACNPEPLVDFVDLFMLGEGEEQITQLTALYRKAKQESWGKDEFLKEATKIEGIYVPKFYDVSYHEDGTIASIQAQSGIPQTVRKHIVQDLSAAYYPETFVVPFLETVHDRAILEVMRGCIRGCRFCQAGFIYRPLREKDAAVLCSQGKALCENTGYEEISLSSLSTSDYKGLPDLLDDLIDYSVENKVNLSLPSLRIDNFSEELLEKVKKVRKSGLTFAPEAGTQRMRDVINKNITEEDIFSSCKIAFEGDYTSVKLYFMLGLPTETMADCEGIIDLAEAIIQQFFQMETRVKGRGVNVTVSVSTFVPKPFTPFQWFGQDDLNTIVEKQRHIKNYISSRRISFKYHASKTSVLEAVFARGDRRLGEVVYRAWKKGCYFDSWDEHFYYDRWMEAMDECGLHVQFYANRHRPVGEIFPWSHLDYGVEEAFLRREWEKAQQETVTPHCREQCTGCGANRLLERKGGKCVE